MKLLFKRLLVGAACLTVSLGVTEFLFPSNNSSSQRLVPTLLSVLLMGLLLIGLSLVHRENKRR